MATKRRTPVNQPTSHKNKQQQNQPPQLQKKLTDSQLKSQWTNMSNMSSLIPTICMGIIFGFTLNKGRVFEPQVIINQFQFTRWIMMKMFLSAAATSIISMYVLKFIAPKQYSIARSSKAKYNLLSVLIGGAILGIGMSLAGACPGMVLISIGAGINNSIRTFIGGCFGALCYGLIEPFIRSYFTNKTIAYAFIDDMMGNNTKLVSIVLSVFMFALVFILEALFPWKQELTSALQDNCSWLECKAWNPIIAGIIVGVIQIPAVVTLGTTIGCSSSYVVLIGQWLRLLPKTSQNLFKAIGGKINSFWQVVYVFSAIFGSMLAVQVSGTMNVSDLQTRSFDDIQGTNKHNAFIGGFLMIFGARLAGGCTSGHGLSGVGMLSTASMIAVVAMFGGGAMVALVGVAY